MSAVRIAHIITKLEFGGAQQVALFTVSHLDQTRFRPLLISGVEGFLDRDAQSLPGVRFLQEPTLVRPLRPWLDARAMVRLSSLLKQWRPAIVHTHSSKAGILGRLAARLAGVPIIIHTIHGYGFTPRQWWMMQRTLIAMERMAARVTTRFFAVSESLRRVGVELHLFPSHRCSVIRPGIDLEAWRRVQVDVTLKRRQLGLDPYRPVVGMIAALKPQKAPLDFVQVASLIARERSDTQFVLIGGGELRSKVEAEVDRLGLSNCFLLPGWRRDVQELLRCLDIFVLTSLWEGLPRVYLEARLSGVPVVGTRVDGAEEIIKEGLNGYLLDPGDVKGMADRVLWLLSNPTVAAAVGRQGQSLSKEFDIHEMVRLQAQEYDMLLAGLQRGSLEAQTKT